MTGLTDGLKRDDIGIPTAIEIMNENMRRQFEITVTALWSRLGHSDYWPLLGHMLAGISVYFAGFDDEIMEDASVLRGLCHARYEIDQREKMHIKV